MSNNQTVVQATTQVPIPSILTESLNSLAKAIINQTASETIESLQRQVYSRFSKEELMKVIASEIRLKNSYMAKYYELKSQEGIKSNFYQQD